MSKHTPGPWTIYPHTKGIDIIVDDGADGKGIATARNANDAALIAAAPYMFEALQTIVANAASVQMDPQWAVRVARAAMNKAKGEEK